MNFMNFVNIPLILSFFIILHHFIKHKNDKHLNFFQKIFQICDIDNHETVALFFLGMGIGMNIN